MFWWPKPQFHSKMLASNFRYEIRAINKTKSEGYRFFNSYLDSKRRNPEFVVWCLLLKINI